MVKNKLFRLLVILLTLCVTEEQDLRNLQILQLVPLLICSFFLDECWYSISLFPLIFRITGLNKPIKFTEHYL